MITLQRTLLTSNAGIVGTGVPLVGRLYSRKCIVLTSAPADRHYIQYHWMFLVSTPRKISSFNWHWFMKHLIYFLNPEAIVSCWKLVTSSRYLEHDFQLVASSEIDAAQQCSLVLARLLFWKVHYIFQQKMRTLIANTCVAGTFLTQYLRQV